MRLKEQLTEAQLKLKIVNELPHDSKWSILIELKKKNSYYDRDISIYVTLDKQVVQQQLVLEVSKLQRNIAKIGGTVS